VLRIETVMLAARERPFSFGDHDIKNDREDAQMARVLLGLLTGDATQEELEDYALEVAGQIQVDAQSTEPAPPPSLDNIDSSTH